MGPYRVLPKPRGGAAEIKHVYSDFWDILGIFRVNMSDADRRIVTYQHSFASVLTLPERLSFREVGRLNVWICLDATLARCDAVNHDRETFTVCDAEQ